MAVGLSRLVMAVASGRRRRVALFVLAIVVAAIHGCVTKKVVDGLAEADADRDLPPRMEVAYVREMAPTAPPPTLARRGRA